MSEPENPPIAPPILLEMQRPPNPRDDDGFVAADLACRRCGEAIRGCRTEATCPGCGMAIARSLFGDALRSCDRQWVRRLARGTLLALIGVPTAFALNIGLGWANFAYLTSMRDPSLDVIRNQLLTVAIMIPWLIVIMGMWMATTPDPCLQSAESRFNARRLARYCPFALVAGTLLNVLSIKWYRFDLPMAQPPHVLVLQYAGSMMTLVAIVGYLAALRFFRTLATRLARGGLRRHLNVAFWGSLVLVAFLIPSMMYGVMTMPESLDGKSITIQPNAMNQLMALSLCTAYPVLIAMVVWGLIQTGRLQMALRTVAAKTALPA